MAPIQREEYESIKDMWGEQNEVRGGRETMTTMIKIGAGEALEVTRKSRNKGVFVEGIPKWQDDWPPIDID